MEAGRIPNKLKRYRHCAGYSQKKVAQLLGLADTSLISRWEHGQALPGTKYMFALSHIYNTLPHLLFDHLWNAMHPEKSLLTHPESLNSNATFNL